MTPLDLDQLDVTVTLGGVPENDLMTGGEFRMVREFLGLTVEWLAGYFDVQPRQVRRWEYDERAISEGIREGMEDLEFRTGAWIGAVIEALNDMPDPGVWIYRNDEEFHTAHPEIEFPARWHTHAVARIALEVPGLRVAYAPGPEGSRCLNP